MTRASPPSEYDARMKQEKFLAKSNARFVTLAVGASLVVLALAAISLPSRHGFATTPTTTITAAGKQIQITNPRVVVELFTSQGCSSCPPADKLMNELALERDLVALTLPIQYWDYLGWKDTFATRANTSRQQSYADFFGDHKYTPQIVINGEVDVIGSKRSKVLGEIASRSAQNQFPVRLDSKLEDEKVVVTVSEAPQELQSMKAELIAITYRAGDHTVAIKKGENRGRTVAYSNVVDEFTKLKNYTGEPISHAIPLANLIKEGADSCAIVLQDQSNGRIVGALKIAAVN